MIEKIATDVSNKLINSAPSSDFDGLVGIRAHMERMNLFLCLDSHEVKMIGIWGPSGIGKSTIARAMFSKHSLQFQLSFFMENIRRRYPSNHGSDEYSGKLQLQKEFLSQILNQEELKIHHLGVVQDRLKDKRVFVVLDDVDHSMQLEAMAKETQWFGPGSRIIITTQDKKLLSAHGINHIYKVGFPAYEEALEIFSMYAFGQKTPYEGFENFAWEVTQLAGRLPLGLRVMGSYMKGRTNEEWKRELPRLRNSLDGEIESILEFSYNALRAEDKELFLYIACFFNKERIEKVEDHLAKSFSDVSQGLQVLAEKSFISYTPVEFGLIRMHDLLARLGREIVRKQSIHDAGQRQFLVDARDVCKVLNNDTVSRGSVIGAIITFYEIENEFTICDSALESMSNLQFLRLYRYTPSGNSDLPQTLNLPQRVRLLDWTYFPKTCLPSNLNLEFLVELNMRSSNLEKLWEGIKMIRNLKWMDLSESYNLRELPDLSTAINLYELFLSHCLKLVELTSSIKNAIKLKRLDISGCSSLVKLPSCIGNAFKLKLLDVSGCTRLVELPSSIQSAIKFKELNFSGFSSLVKLPTSIGNTVNFRRLNLSHCSSLVELPSSIGNVTSLEVLDLSDCSSLMKLPSSIGNISSLIILDLSGCSSLVELPSSIGNIKLQRLRLKGCSKLEAIRININIESRYELDITDCLLLKNFPEISTNMEFPRTGLVLHISYWEHLQEFAHAFQYITELHLSDQRIQEIAPWIKELSRLRRLVLKGCTKLVSLPQLPGSLQFLNAGNCESLERLHCSFHNNKFFFLNFANCFKLNQEARDLIIIKASSCYNAILPGEKVPTHFTYRATGKSLSMKLNGIDTRHLRFIFCVLLVNKGDVEVGDWNRLHVTTHIKEKQNVTFEEASVQTCNFNSIDMNIYVYRSENIDLSTRLKKHLFIFQSKEEELPRLSSSSSELVFELIVKNDKFLDKRKNNEKFEIEECGIEECPEAYYFSGFV